MSRDVAALAMDYRLSTKRARLARGTAGILNGLTRFSRTFLQRALFYAQKLNYPMTNSDELTQRKFPIGPFKAPENLGKPELESLIETIASAPAQYREIARGLSETDLRKTYREGAWNIQQLIHHVADIQLLHMLRMKKALTEPDYRELTLIDMDGWAQTPDARTAPLEDSFLMFEGIAKRFVYLLKSLTEEQLQISYYHPVRKTNLNQKQAIAMAAWHVRHHLEHIRIALKG